MKKLFMLILGLLMYQYATACAPCTMNNGTGATGCLQNGQCVASNTTMHGWFF